MRIQDMMTQNKFLNILTTLILSTAATINTLLYGSTPNDAGRD